MSVEGRAGGRNFVSANRVLRDESCPVAALCAIDARFAFRPPIALFLV